MRVSRGTLFLLPQGGALEGGNGGAAAKEAGAGKVGIAGLSASSSAAGAQPVRGAQRWGDGPVARAFEAFTRQQPDLAEQINAMMQQEVGRVGLGLERQRAVLV